MRLVKRYERDIDWNIGCLFAHDDFVIKVIKVCKEAGTDPKITNVFGSIPCIFQGGRVPPRTATLSDSFDILSRYNELNIGCRLTFSNPNIEEKDLSDTTSNELLNHLNKSSGNGVIVTSDLLAKYIKEKYSNLQIISSQVKPSVEVGLGKDEVDYYNNLFELYDIVVVNPMKVHDAKFLKEIKYPEQVEFIANHKCLPNCPMAGEHYRTVAELCKRMLTQADTEKTEKRLDDIMSWCLKTRQKARTSQYSYQKRRSTKKAKLLITRMRFWIMQLMRCRNVLKQCWNAECSLMKTQFRLYSVAYLMTS